MCGTVRVDTSHLNNTQWKIRTGKICSDCGGPIFEWHIRTYDPDLYAQKILDCELGFCSYACVGDA